ncbi:MAG: hypothetical protein ACI88C_000353 [Acidimicrobiales bacterium]|jgi:hypothetical protein
MTRLLSSFSLLAAVALPCVSAVAQSVAVPLNYNFNGIVHAGEAGLPDDPIGFRSMSDRALDFSAGIPSDPLLAEYQLVGAPTALDMVHLGNRNLVAGGIWAFDPTPDGDNIGIQPLWLPNVDQSGPQTTVLATPLVVIPDSSIGFLYQITNGGGSFDVTVTFQSGASHIATLSGPDWFLGTFLGTDGTDAATPDNNLSLTEGRIDLSAFVGETITEVSFSNQSNSTGGYGIVACNFGVQATTTVLGQGCIREFTSFYEQMDSASFDLTNMDIMATSAGGSYVVIPLPGTGPLPVGGVDPAGGTVLVLPDDGEVPAGTLGMTVGSNGWMAEGTGNSNAWAPVVAVMLSNPAKTIYAWTDLQPNTSGTVTYEEDVATGQTRVTFDGVNGWGTQDPCFIQIDYNVITGDWVMRFGIVGFANPEDWIVGYSPDGLSADPGPVDISAVPVIVTGTVDIIPLSLASTTRPVLGTSWDLEVVDIPATTVFGLTIWGLSDPGIPDLNFLGLPGCELRANLDIVVGPWLPTGSTYAYSLLVPATPLSLSGFVLFTQAATFGNPAVNSFGAITSNGIKGTLGSF